MVTYFQSSYCRTVSIVRLATSVEGDLKATFSIATTPFPGLLHFTLDSHLIVLIAKQGGIKNNFFESFV